MGAKVLPMQESIHEKALRVVPEGVVDSVFHHAFGAAPMRGRCDVQVLMAQAG